MSEQLEDSGFTTEGFRPFPSIYQDEAQVANFSLWSREALNGRFAEYTEFLKEDRMPRATESARRILTHLLFELSYREGFYD